MNKLSVETVISQLWLPGVSVITIEHDGPLHRPGDGHFRAGSYAVVPVKRPHNLARKICPGQARLGRYIA